MIEFKFSGLVAAPFTPMNATGDVDPEMIPLLAGNLKENGVAGAFINGSTGEGVSLTHEEKYMQMEAWAKEQTADFKIIALIATNSLREGREMIREAAQLGLFAAAILPPFYYKITTAAELADYCVELSSEVPDLPLYYYHIPSLSGVKVPMIEFLKAIHGRMPQLAGIKYTDSDLMDFRQCLTFEGGEYDILWGIDEYLLGALAMGAKAGVGSTYNYAAPVYHQLISYYEAGNMDEARKWQSVSIGIVEILRKHGGMAAGKYFMKYIGLDCGDFRAPVGGIESPAQFEADLEMIGFEQYASELAVGD